MKAPSPAIYEVRFGRKAEEGSDMDLLAAYAVQGFAAGTTSRFDQVMAGMDELPLPPEVDWLEMERRDRIAEQATGLRVVTRSGLVAELLDTSPDTGMTASASPAVSAQPASIGELPGMTVLPVRLIAGDTPPGGIELPAFPVKSIFASSEASA